ncbi:hypothetical protein FRC03_003122 [Tulasnella sp. 419]|nr:hypothetical protein FRC03_003122 [Tulasnella sp. 419]
MTGGSPIYASSSSTKGLQLDNVNGAAVVKTSGSLYWTYSATGSSLSTLNYINRCKVVKYLNVEESSPYSYKPLSFGDTPSTTYWSLTKGGNLKTTANSPYGVVSDFVVCGGPQWKVYLQTGTDLPSSQTGQYCETTTLTLQ